MMRSCINCAGRIIDVMLDSTFESAEALKQYAIHPEHVAVADNNVRPYTAVRMCLDFEI